ncbi:MAG TPA: PA0069 family radical SAM protein [Acetobacteraceae bacterium]|jgi:DNA repair photolyase|nr:PA0069 family radical SAM protein [Acetobacteraceae bacterium]
MVDRGLAGKRTPDADTLPEPPSAAPMPSLARRGRGATTNPPVRYDMQSASPFDDGWDTLDGDFSELPKLATTLTRDASRSAISWNTSPDIGFDRAVNPYRGCEHGCIYCYARPTHAYLGYSPGLDFETKLIFKPEVAELLEKEFRKPGYTARTLALGSNTDPYQPVERTLKLTRAVLQVLDRFNHPVGIVTKSAGVLRDLDILTSMAQRKLARVYVSVTTLDAALARRMEPRAATPERRLHAIAELTRAGVPAGVMVAPMIPGLNDAEMEKIVEAAARAGARHAGYVLLRLPHELRQMFEDWLATHFPDRAKHVLNLIRETRSGALSDARFHHRFSGQGVYADLLLRRFARVTRQWGLDQAREGLDCGRFAVPADGQPRFAEAQMSLF